MYNNKNLSSRDTISLLLGPTRDSLSSHDSNTHTHHLTVIAILSLEYEKLEIEDR
jgi:hypothetical protein